MLEEDHVVYGKREGFFHRGTGGFVLLLLPELP